MLLRDPQDTAPTRRRVHLHITGAVQGVGFRPFVYRLATELKLGGWVRNDSRGLDIEIEGEPHTVDTFINRVEREAPPVSRIGYIERRSLPTIHEDDFHIVASDVPDNVRPRPSVLPDLATCPECLAEARDPEDRRYRYPFTSCTQCGPRWSIIEALPYDRPNTAMAGFPLCPDCEREYTDPASRRFHHQANTCPVCGPQLTLWDDRGTVLAEKDGTLTQTVEALRRGEIVALKGIGGFQLLADAGNDAAVTELRRRKQRPAKPLAIMCRDMDGVSAVCRVNDVEREQLQSAAAPIVLLRRQADDRAVAESVAPGNPYLGVMLPYSILHQLLLDVFGGSIVCTSGNVSGEPICIDEHEALQRLGAIADRFLVHDRPVARPLDDSVVQVVMNLPMILRRARGYAPTPLSFELDKTTPPLLAVGAHLKNTVAQTLYHERGRVEILLSAHLGDLDNVATREAFNARVDNLKGLYRVEPELIVHDLHPDYSSSRYARETGLQTLAVQHHWAHIAACMAEHRLDKTVLGLAWDGVGLGDDNRAWGGELLRCDYHGYERLAAFHAFPLPGGDRAALHIRRALLGVMYALTDGDIDAAFGELPEGLFNRTEQSQFGTLLERALNTPATTSAGRLFDAAACLLGIGTYNRFEGEAAIALQFAAETGRTHEIVELPLNTAGDLKVLDWRPLVRRLIDGRRAGESPADLALLFHRSLAAAAATLTSAYAQDTVALSGGCFQNRLLLELTVEALQATGKKVYWPQQVPANDGGLAFGQAAIGLHKIANHGGHGEHGEK